MSVFVDRPIGNPCDLAGARGERGVLTSADPDVDAEALGQFSDATESYSAFIDLDAATTATTVVEVLVRPSPRIHRLAGSQLGELGGEPVPESR